MNLKRIFAICIVLFTATWTVVGQEDPCKSVRTALASRDAPTYTLGEISKLPNCFDGAFVEVVGIYRAAFENSDLYDPVDQSASAWMTDGHFYSAVQRCSSPDALKSLNRKNGGTWGIRALGIVKTSGRFGHMSGWQMEFQMICLEDASLLADLGNIFQAQKPRTQAKINDWYRSQSRKRQVTKGL